MEEQFGYRPVTLGDELHLFEVMRTREPDYGHISDAETRADLDRRNGNPHSRRDRGRHSSQNLRRTRHTRVLNRHALAQGARRLRWAEL